MTNQGQHKDTVRQTRRENERDGEERKKGRMSYPARKRPEIPTHLENVRGLDSPPSDRPPTPSHVLLPPRNPFLFSCPHKPRTRLGFHSPTGIPTPKLQSEKAQGLLPSSLRERRGTLADDPWEASEEERKEGRKKERGESCQEKSACPS